MSAKGTHIAPNTDFTYNPLSTNKDHLRNIIPYVIEILKKSLEKKMSTQKVKISRNQKTKNQKIKSLDVNFCHRITQVLKIFTYFSRCRLAVCGGPDVVLCNLESIFGS